MNPDKPITLAMMVDALSCFHNGAISAAHASQDSTAQNVASALSSGIDAVSFRLGEFAAMAAPSAPNAGRPAPLHFDADDVFFETLVPYHADIKVRRVCLGVAGNSFSLTITRTGGVEVWNSADDDVECVAGAGFDGPSKIEVAGVVLFDSLTAWKQENGL